MTTTTRPRGGVAGASSAHPDVDDLRNARRGRPLRVLRSIAFGIFAGVNVALLVRLFFWAFGGDVSATDWTLISDVNPLAPYAHPVFRWSVPAAWIWAWLVVPMGAGLWAALHLAALATIRNRGVILLALATFPFWYDLANGNILTFVFVAGWHALAGRRLGIVAFVVLAALVPRPLMAPVLAYLLVRHRVARWWFAAAAVVVVGSALATGALLPWLGRLAGTPGPEMSAAYNMGPSALIGAVWIPLGMLLGAVAWWRGRLGLASLLISPYMLHYYAIVGMLELQPWRPVPAVPRSHRASSRSSLEPG